MRKIKSDEIRNIKYKVEIRSAVNNNDGTATLEGYIAKFNSPTVLFSGYAEQIDPHAFDDTLKDGHNIFLLYAHDWTKPLASTGAGTLILEIDNIGLHFIATVDTGVSYIADVVALVKNGLIVGCSFGFSIIDDKETYDSNTDTITDTLTQICLYEGSILSDPQYTDTTVSARAKLKKVDIEKEKDRKNEQRKLRKKKLELELDL
ncbi:HK97 family phage prohead protease [Clostridium tyrobutyricum]|uniref:HK97 family phage prohead protease n=1 Tax=Clostridium tyrobutyricum TaxID=1519 RepID=UPI0034A0C3D2